MQATRTVFDIGRLIHGRVFKDSQTHEIPHLQDLLSRNLGQSSLSTDSGTFIGWGIEIVEGPSWIFNCLQSLPPLLSAAITWTTISIFSYLSPKAGRKWTVRVSPEQRQNHEINLPKSTTDKSLIVFGFALLILFFVKVSRMLDPQR